MPELLNKMPMTVQLAILALCIGWLGACTGGDSPSGSGAKSAADWSKANETEGYAAYADRGSIRKADETVMMSDLFDYKTAQTDGGAPALSKITVREYDCQNQKSQALKTTWYAGPMGTGAAVRTSGAAGQLSSVAPGTATAALMTVACGP